MPLQGWDAVRILTQIASLQTIHYLILAALLPPFLAIFADTSSLMFEGGPTQVGMVFDWRQVAGRPTYDWTVPALQQHNKGEGWRDWTSTGDESKHGASREGEAQVDPAVLVAWNLDNVWLDTPLNSATAPQDKVLDHDRILRFKKHSNGTTTASSPYSSSNELSTSTGSSSVELALEHWEWSHTADSRRSYTLIVTWLLTAPLDILLLVYLVRRPTHMLDHALTFHLLNLGICSYYAGCLPTSLKWWLTMLVHAAVMVVWSEQLAIKRELNRSVGYNLVGTGADQESVPTTKSVLFDQDHEGSAERIELRPL